MSVKPLTLGPMSAFTQPAPDLSFLTRPTPPDLSGLRGQQQQYLDQGFAPEQEAQSPISKKDLPFLLLGLLGASAFGVKPKEINAGFQGFMGVRQQVADQKNQKAQKDAQIKRQRAQTQYAQVGDEIQRQEKDFEHKRGLYEENQRDLRNFDQTKKLKEIEQKGLTDRANLRDPLKVAAYKALGSTPQGKVQLGELAGLDADAREALAQLTIQEQNTVSQTKERDAMLPGKVEGQSLKNQYQRIMNEYLPASLKGKIQLTKDQSEYIQTKIKYYPEYLRATMARVEIARSLADSQIFDRTFNQGMDVWKAQNKPAIDALQKELDAHLKEIAKLENQPDTLGLGAFDTVNKAVRLEKLNSRVSDIEARMSELTGTLPASFQSFESVPNGKQSTIPAPLGGKTLPGVTNPRTGQPAGAQPTKTPANTQGPNSTKAKADAMKKKYGR